ncbi:hypothetical protein DFJ74DRAFT_660662 [Hyaloraphidium curvatum]|nr:hypothetical protein DFJ74DRAFT_660662 [Hyaloraphidium curvatum]
MSSALLSLVGLGAARSPLIVLCGEPHTGKSQLLQAWDADGAPKETSPIPLSATVAAPTHADRDAVAHFEEISEVRAYLRLDVINQRMRARNDELLRRADLALVLVDVARKGSLDAVLNRWWDEEIAPRNPKLPVVLVLTHTDATLTQFSMSMDHHVQPAAIALPTCLRIFTLPLAQSRAQVLPIFEYAISAARNPRAAAAEAAAARASLGGFVETVHVEPAASACGMFLLGQVRGLAELRACARATNERMEDVVRQVVRVVGAEGLRDIGAGEMLPDGVAGDLVLGKIPGVISGDPAAQEAVRARAAAEGLSVDELAMRVVRAVGRDAADRLGVALLLAEGSALPGTPKPDRSLLIRQYGRSESRSSGRMSVRSVSGAGESPRPPSSLGRTSSSGAVLEKWRRELDGETEPAVSEREADREAGRRRRRRSAEPAPVGEAEEADPRKSTDSADGDAATFAGDAHEHEDGSGTERSDETVNGAKPKDDAEAEERGKPPRLRYPPAVPLDGHAVEIAGDLSARPPPAQDDPYRTPPSGRRISNPPRSAPRASQKAYDRGAFVESLDRLALDDALEEDGFLPPAPPPSPASFK